MLTGKDVQAALWPFMLAAFAGDTDAAREWLGRVIMFVSLFPDLPFPAGFLAGTTAIRLGEPVIEYILQRRDDLAGLHPLPPTPR